MGGDLAGVEVQQISTYGDCSLAVSREGQLYGWGNSEYLQLASVTEATQVRKAEQLTYTDTCQLAVHAVQLQSPTQLMMFKHSEL